jgi:phage terminase large subunit-like protein
MLVAANRHFPEWAHSGQLAPAACDDGSPWRTWVLMAGRGFGKTRSGAEWVLECVRGGSAEPLRPGGAGPPPPEGEFGGQRGAESPLLGEVAARSADGGGLRIALVAATVDEARRVMVEGESGILACAREDEVVEWAPSRRELHFANGAIATLFSGASPEALRGPQHHIAWCDELAKWRHPEASWDMLQLGLRCGDNPRALVTTTPRGGCAVLSRILAAPDTVQTGGSTRANPHLPESFLGAVERAYGGTRLGRQEIDGVLLADVHGSLWPAALIERCRGPVPPHESLVRVVIGVDPPASAEGTCGIVVCGLDREGRGHVLADCTAGGLSPEQWARKVAAAAEAHGADRIVAEANQGGAMVRSMLRVAGVRLPVTMVSATRSKSARAEPVAGLFETGQARLAGRFPELEEQLAGLVPAGYQGPGGSPDRADAMVWALWALLLAPAAEPRVRAM